MSHPDPGAGWTRVAGVSEIAEEAAISVEVGDTPVCLVRARGRLHAVLDECSHGEVPLSEGDVSDGFIECFLHGSRFDLGTGEPTGPPATRPVPVYGVQVVGDEVYVSVLDVARGKQR
jgi:3-phenylpropionate/trans-cinnamate dioxygenase ferredoxin subunit